MNCTNEASRQLRNRDGAPRHLGHGLLTLIRRWLGNFGGGEPWRGTSFPIGGEVSSASFSYPGETDEQVLTVLEVLRARGADLNARCGFHVHFAADELRGGEDASSATGRQDAFLTRIARLALPAKCVLRGCSLPHGTCRGRVPPRTTIQLSAPDGEA